MSWVGSEHIHVDGRGNPEVIRILLEEFILVDVEEQGVDVVYQVLKARPVTVCFNSSDPLIGGCQTPHSRRMMGPALQSKEGGRNSSNHSTRIPFEGDF